MTKEQLIKAQDEKFNWVGRNQMSWSASSADVTINKVKGKRKGSDCSYSIILRGKAYDAMESSQGVQIATFKNRIMFRPADEGFKALRKDTKIPTIYLNVPHTEDTAEIAKFVGDYSIKHDDFYELDYIERV